MNILQRIMNKENAFPIGYEQINLYGYRKSKHSVSGAKVVYAYPTILAALKKYQSVIDGTNSGGIAIDTNGRYIVEYNLGDTVECAVYNPETGNTMAALYNIEKNKLVEYDVAQEDCSLLILALIDNAMNDEEAKTIYDNVSLMLSDAHNILDWTEFSNHICHYCDNILNRLKIKNQCFSIKNEFERPNVNMIRQTSINTSSYEVGTELFGNIKVLKGSKVVNINNIMPEEFNGQYRLSPNSESYGTEIEVIDDTYYIPKTIIEICSMIKKSTNMNPPFRNVLLFGESGSGKTEGAKAIAAGLGMPYRTYTCHRHTDNFDLVGQFIPLTKGKNDNISINNWLQQQELPSLDDIYYDEKKAYKKITGKRSVPAELTTEMVIKSLMEKMFSIINSKGTNGFRFVPSEIIEALRNGYLVEIQEPTTILDEGVMIALNAILAGGYITLATGERVYRHPNSIVVFTTNTSDYAGYGQLSNSVLSRCALVYEMNTPDVDEMVQRAVKATKFTNKELLKEMAQTIIDIAMLLKDKGVKDGVVGFREYLNWVSAFRILNDLELAAIPTVINKSTFDEDVRNEIADKVTAIC